MIKYLRNNFLEFVNSWRTVWEQRKQEKAVRRKEKALLKAKKLAVRRAKMDGRRYYILPDWDGNYMVLNKSEVEKLKKAGVMSKKVNAYHLMKEAEYFTNIKAETPKVK